MIRFMRFSWQVLYFIRRRRRCFIFAFLTPEIEIEFMCQCSASNSIIPEIEHNILDEVRLSFCLTRLIPKRVSGGEY